MILGKRDLLGNYLDRRASRAGYDGPVTESCVSLERPTCREISVKIRLPFIDRIKTILRGRISDRNFALNRNRTYEIELLPAPLQSVKRQSRLTVPIAAKSAASSADAPLPSRNGVRAWIANKARSDAGKQTPSNLG